MNTSSIKIKLAILIGISLSSGIFAQEADDPSVENDVIPMAGKRGFSVQTRAGDFLLKPYTLVQTVAKYNYYDDEGIELADQDRVFNSGFEIPYALLGVSGKAFDRITFNLTLNAAQSGASLLQQAWFDVSVREQLRFRVGKFKTPYNQAYLVTLGETLFPMVPASLTTSVNIPHSLNAVNPVFATGFDLGVMMHGRLGGKWEYNLGIFNGTGINVNTAQKGVSDDLGVPSLLYSGRLAYMPRGPMPGHQGRTDALNDRRLLLALSTSYNVEAEWESCNDFRAGFEFAWLINRWYLSAEVYYMNMKFTRLQRSEHQYNFLGGYLQGGYFLTDKLQAALRYDFFDRNSTSVDGSLNFPAVGLNYYLFGYNLKLQTMYRYCGRWGHATQDDRDSDDLGTAQHAATAMLQFSF